MELQIKAHIFLLQCRVVFLTHSAKTVRPPFDMYRVTTDYNPVHGVVDLIDLRCNYEGTTHKTNTCVHTPIANENAATQL